MSSGGAVGVKASRVERWAAGSVAVALVEKASNLEDRIDEMPASDLGPRAPDIEPSA
jgi:hypothetical protein